MKKSFLSGPAIVVAAFALVATAHAEDTLKKIKDSGTITEGVRESSGLSYTLGNGQYTGFHYDVCANIIKDLNGKTVATTTGTTSVQTLRKNERAGGIDFKEVYGKDHADSFLALEGGRADAFVMDGSILAANISKSKNPADYKIVGEVLSVEPIACMLPKDDLAFKKAVDDSIKGMIKSGALAKLYDKWFMQPIPPTNTKVGLPLSDATKAAWANPNDKPMEDYAKK